MDWQGFKILESYVKECTGEFDRIPSERKEALAALSASITDHLERMGKVRIIFICTHNSRRSQMGQLWGQLSAAYYGVENVFCFSGGTRATAFNPKAVEALQEAGFGIRQLIPGSNPVYMVRTPAADDEVRAFSKKYTDPPNPMRGFIAVMTCDEADEACPVVLGASRRHSITYEDPKKYDGTPGAREAYSGRCRQIAREMCFLFSLVSSR